jgi:hypothetical protein
MAMKLSTTLNHIATIPNSINSKTITEFYHYMKRALEPLKTIKITSSGPAYSRLSLIEYAGGV